MAYGIWYTLTRFRGWTVISVRPTIDLLGLKIHKRMWKKKTLKLRPIKFKQIDRIIWCNSIVGGGGGSMYIFDLFIDAVAVAIYEMFTFTVA